MQRKTILISGASTGIGFALAQSLSQQGWRVFGGVRNEIDGNRLEKVGVRPVLLDVTSLAQIQSAALKIEAEGGRLDALVNNAGIALGGPLECVPLEDFRYQFEVNFFGTVGLIQKCLPLLRKTQGRIINISSISGLIAFPGLSPYCSSKFAVETVSDALRCELRPFGVKVILIEPGPVNTPIWQKSLAVYKAKLKELTPELMDAYRAQIQKMESNLMQSVKNALSVDKVVECIEQALKERSPKTRYAIGPQVKMTVHIFRFLPDRIRDALFSTMLDRT